MNTSLIPSSIRSVADLKQLQGRMAEALFCPLTSRGVRPPETAADEYIKPNGRLTAFERLEIYHRQYWFRLLDCLHDDYPGLRALLGQRRFQALCRAYLAQCPSESWTLRNLGQRLALFMAEQPQWAGGKQAAALDVARFEWAQVVAFDEGGRAPLSLDALLGEEPEKLRLRLQPYLSLLEMEHAVDDFFMAVRQQDRGLRHEASQALEHAARRSAFRRVPLPKRQVIWLAVHRCDNELYFKRLPREAFLLLTQLHGGATLNAALETALGDADPTQDWATQIRAWFQAWSAMGWFCRS